MMSAKNKNKNKQKRFDVKKCLKNRYFYGSVSVFFVLVFCLLGARATEAGPTAPTSVSAWTDATKAVSLVNNGWNEHNNSPSAYFEWSGGVGVSSYYVYFGSNSLATPSIDGTQTTNTYASENIANPVSGSNYYLIIQSEDSVGNLSNPATLFTYKFDNVQPSPVAYIMPSPSGWSDTDPYSFSWPSSSDPTSGIAGYEYERSNGTDNWAFTTDLSVSNLDHYQAGVNYFNVRAEDNAGNFSPTTTADYYYSGSVASPSNLQVDLSESQGQTLNLFNFNWAAPDGTTPEGYYYSVNATPSLQNSTYTTAQSTGFLPLATQTGLNTFYVVCKDQYGNIGWSNYAQLSFSINTVAPMAPTNLSVTDSSNRDTGQYSLTIMWVPPTTISPDFYGYVVERSTDGVNYTTRATLDKSNTGYLDTGLTNATDYYYEIESIDDVGNVSPPSAPVNFTPTGKYTSAPTITTAPSVVVKATTATISWDTNRSSNSIVQYGTSNNYGAENSESTTYNFNHSVTLNGLTPGALYHYRVASIDNYYDYSEDSAFSGDLTFTTLAAPAISNVSASSIGLSSALISWKTTTAATSDIVYGTTTNYGQTYTDPSDSQTTNHTVLLNNLTDATTYHYKVGGSDVDGNDLLSDDYTFTTLTYPKLSDLLVSHINGSRPSATQITLNSNVPTSVLVTFTGNGGENVSQYTLSTSHQLSLTGLMDNTAYTVSAVGRDAYGNQTTAISTIFTTPYDTTPPLITGITVVSSVVGYDNNASAQAIVSWSTDKPGTSQVDYGSGVAGDIYTAQTSEDTTMTVAHVVIISGLKTSAPYHFRVVSADSDGNVGMSGDNTVLTQQASLSVLQLVINTLQTSLGWIFTSIKL